MPDMFLKSPAIAAAALRSAPEGGPPPAASQASPSIAVFDLDETITRSDTFLWFLIGCLGRSPQRWYVAPLLAWAVLMFVAGRRDNSWLKSYFLRWIVGGRTQRAIDPWVDTYVERVLRREVLPAARAELARLRQSGVRLVLASASPDIYVEPLGRRLGFEHVVCTRVARLADGRWSGALEAGNCYGAEKKRRVERYLAARGERLRDVAFYSDHHSDLPLFEAAGQRFAVNPTSAMTDLARRMGIPMLHWRE